MGNTCYCNNSQQEANTTEQPSDVGDETPRLLLKPERLPHLSHAVKSQSKKLDNDKSEANRFISKIPNADTKVVINTNQQLPNQHQPLGQINNNNNILSDLRSSQGNQGYQQKQNTQQQYINQEEIKEQKPLTLFQKIGGEEGIKTFTEKVMEKALSDPMLSPYFKSTNMELLKEKFRYYIAFLLGEHKLWIGKSLQEAHKNIPISDELFDAFISLCVQSLKDMRVKHDCLKETTRTLQSLRDTLVKKPSEQSPNKTLFEEIGGLEVLKKIAEQTMKDVSTCPTLSPFFEVTDISLHQKRLAHYFTFLTGGQQEWLGRTPAQAHKGKLICHEHFGQFIVFLRKAMQSLSIPKTTQDKFINEVKNLKDQISQDRQSLTLYQQLNFNGKFDEIINLYIEKMVKDSFLSYYFNRSGNKKCVASIFTLLFKSANANHENQMKTLKQQHYITKLDDLAFEKSIILLKEALYENNTDQALVEEALAFYKTFRKYLVYDPEESKLNHDLEDKKAETEKIISCPFKKEPSQKESDKKIASFKILDSGSQAHESSHIASIQHEVEKINKQIEEQTLNNGLENEQIIAEPDLKEQLQIKQIDQQILKYEQSHQASRQNSPIKSKRPNQYKYFFIELLNEAIQYEGLLQRFMDKQKTQLPRWIILRQSALFIYKDQMNSKSFPQKPLYCIPLEEIKSITQSENTIYPNQRKSQAIHTLQIELKECYGTIAQSVAQLLTGSVLMGNNLHQQQGVLRDVKNNHKSQQNHDYNDTALLFVSQSKKDIFNWVKRIKSSIGGGEVKNADLTEIINGPNQKQSEQNENEVQKTIFERVGGAPAIDVLVKGMYEKIFADSDLSDFFRKTNSDHQLEMQRQFLTYATGGTKQWNGKSMYDAHKGRGIGVLEFEKVAGHVISTLKELGVCQALTDEIVALLLSLKDDIIETPNGEEKDKYEEEEKVILDDQTNKVMLEEGNEVTLYQRLGGEGTINDLVEGMYAKIFADPDLTDFFKKTHQEHQREMQVKFLTFATGGSKEWKGKSMFDAHKGRGIQSYHFDKVALHVVTTLQELNVTQPLINEVVSLLLPLKKQIAEDEKQYEQFKNKATLFERLGGADSINALVEKMYEKIFVDPELSDFFRKTDKEKQKEMQKLFLTYATCGANEWKGKSMVEAHRGRGIRGEDYQRVVDHIVKSLEELNVKEELILELNELLHLVKGSIVGQ